MEAVMKRAYPFLAILLLAGAAAAKEEPKPTLTISVAKPRFALGSRSTESRRARL